MSRRLHDSRLSPMVVCLLDGTSYHPRQTAFTCPTCHKSRMQQRMEMGQAHVSCLFCGNQYNSRITAMCPQCGRTKDRQLQDMTDSGRPDSPQPLRRRGRPPQNPRKGAV